jgi:hypothetical protein
VVKNTAEKDIALQALKEKYNLSDTVIKNSWDIAYNSGYRSINIKLQIDGKPVEIQIVPDTLIEASETGRGHAVYEELRTLLGIEKVLEKSGESMPQVLKDQIFDLELESKTINQNAWIAFSN